MKNKDRQSPFEREIARAERLYRELRRPLEAMRLKHDGGDAEGANGEAFSFAHESEKLTLAARQLPAYSGHPLANSMIKQHILGNMPIRIGFTAKGWFMVELPALLPKKDRGSAEYILEPMYLSMQEYWRGKDPVRFPDCVMAFRHVYRRDRPERQYRDHDNIELNAVINAIALYVLYDDSPLRCAHYYCSAPGNENRTEVFVVPQGEFGMWLLDAKSYDGSAVYLHENRP